MPLPSLCVQELCQSTEDAHNGRPVWVGLLGCGFIGCGQLVQQSE